MISLGMLDKVMRKEHKKRQIGFILLCVVGFIGLSGCAVPELQKKSVLQSMVGQSSVDVLRRFGVPNRNYQTQGHTFLSYVHTQENYSPGGWGGGWNGGYGYGYGWGPGLGSWGGGMPPSYSTSQCQTTFELENDRVTGWTLRGDGC